MENSSWWFLTGTGHISNDLVKGALQHSSTICLLYDSVRECKTPKQVSLDPVTEQLVDMVSETSSGSLV